ncbi:MAG: glycosyltransferase family 2 protein [Patescibacteria group bacterium]|nr:glycosyltransferase family 2 protein [Patescibacteria group bacterium]
MFQGQKVSLILPTYNEKDSIRKVINDFAALGVVDEILVINNNAAAGTSEEVRQTSAKEIFEPIQGYGQAIRRGFAEATGDLIAVCEPDDTFLAKDIFKFLVFSEEVDIVYGSRTIKNYIWAGANMGRFLRWGNWFVAKLIEALFNTNYLSDVGCTYRLIKRPALEKILPLFRVRSNFFGPEMMIRGYLRKLACVQIPVNYKDRVGESSVTGDLKKAFILGMKMIVLIIAMRFCCEKALIKYLD